MGIAAQEIHTICEEVATVALIEFRQWQDVPRALEKEVPRALETPACQRVARRARCRSRAFPCSECLDPGGHALQLEVARKKSYELYKQLGVTLEL